MKRTKLFSWRCRFTECNSLCLRETYITASSLGDVIIKLHEVLKPEFIANHLLEVSFDSVYYE